MKTASFFVLLSAMVLLSACESTGETAPPPTQAPAPASSPDVAAQQSESEQSLTSQFLTAIEIKANSERIAADGIRKYSASGQSASLKLVEQRYAAVSTKGYAWLQGYKLAFNKDFMKRSPEEELHKALTEKTNELHVALMALDVEVNHSSETSSVWNVDNIVSALIKIWKGVQQMRIDERDRVARNMAKMVDTYQWATWPALLAAHSPPAAGTPAAK